MRSTYSPYAEARPGVSGLRDQKHSVGSEALTVEQPHSAQNHCAKSWRPITYLAVLLSLLFLASFAWMHRDFRRRDIPEWKPVLALADTARERGDLYYAKSLYSQVGRLAAWREDWAGLVAAACAMKSLDQQKGPYSSTNALLLRAMVSAETRQSRSGMVAVATAFARLGEDKVASTALSRIQKNWVEKTNDSADVVAPGCWAY
jgi:hypothetical protein